MRIGIIGSGNVGKTLAAGFARRGHTAGLGSRDPSNVDLRNWAAGAGVSPADLFATARDAEIVVLATAWDGTENALSLIGAAALSGKILIDVTNPLHFTDRLELAIGHDDSGGEQVQRWAPGALVVKAFNTVGFELMDDPHLDGGPGTMFIAGDDAGAKATVTRLIHDFGWSAHDCGDLRAARLTEPVAMIWIEHALRTGQRDHVLRLLGVTG